MPNTLTGEGSLNVELTFESMDDFSCGGRLRLKVDALNKLLTARQQLSNLITYMDGKSRAEELIAKVLNVRHCSSRWRRHPSRRTKPGG